MDAAFTYSLYGVAVILLGVSVVKDRKKTALALKRAWKMFINVLPVYKCLAAICVDPFADRAAVDDNHV